MKYTEVRKDRYVNKMEEFDSIHEFTERIGSLKNNSIMTRYNSRDGDKYFTGTETYEEAQELLNTGWIASAKKISLNLPVQTAQGQVPRTKPTYNVVGGQASVPRYLQGIPTNMVDRKQVPAKQKIIVINKSIGFNAFVTKEEMEAEGIKALQVIQALEHKGFRVKLNLYWATQSGRENLVLRICVKQPAERLSIAKVAFPIAHPSMLRRIGFKWLETHQTMSERSFVNGYGRSLHDSSGVRGLFDPKEYILPSFIKDPIRYAEELVKMGV